MKRLLIIAVASLFGLQATQAQEEYGVFDRHMGNKFVIDNATGSVEFQKENSYMNVTLDANISGKKTFNAKLTMMLEQVPEIK